MISFLIGLDGWAQSNNYSINSNISYNNTFIQDSNDSTVHYPDPKKVLRRSLIIPGWGQVTNKQLWKVPIVYGLLGGLTYYSIELHKNYNDYRAAYYNLNSQTPDDFKFGPTPDYISINADLSSLQTNRDFYRNRRDFIYITIVLAYALNVIDAYVFAHLRSFDVSDDLTMNANIKPSIINTKIAGFYPSVSFSLKLGPK